VKVSKLWRLYNFQLLQADDLRLFHKKLEATRPSLPGWKEGLIGLFQVVPNMQTE